MINNDILRRIRYVFDFGDDKIIKIFGLADYPVSREQISDWLKKEEDPAFKSCHDTQLAIFLNGLIVLKRGPKEGSDGSSPPPEKRLTNNLIFTKLKIALNLKSDDILAIMDLAGFSLSKHELSAFFRKPGHKHHRPCHDQVLRNFLQGLQIKHRGEAQAEAEPGIESEIESETGPETEPQAESQTTYPWKSITEISQDTD